MKRFLFPTCILILFLFCIFYPSLSIAGAAAGLSLWYCTVLPTLLPCMVLSSYLISSDLITRLPAFPMALVTGWFCGYPMGAKTTADLWRAGRLSAETANRLLLLVCEPSPMFLTGFLCAGMLRIPSGKILPCLLSVYLPAVICFGVITALEKRRSVSSWKEAEKAPEQNGKPQEPSGFLSCFLTFEEAMMKGFLLIAKIGVYLMLFTMLSYFFVHRVNDPFLRSLVPGILEMTSGTAFTVQSGLPETMTAALCFSYAAFGGLSGMAQTISVLGNTPLSRRRVFLSKAVQAGMTFLILYCFYPLF